MPGERAEFIVDFGTAVVGDRLVLHNFGPDAPLSDLTATGFNDPATTGVVMQFRVTAGAPDTGYNPATGPAIRAGAQQIVRLVDPATGTLAAGVTVDKIRALTLNEIAFDTPRTTPVDGTGLVYNWVGGPLEAVVNNSKWNGLRPDPAMPNEHMSPPLLPVNGGQSDGLMNWLTEFPVEGTTEIWEIINTTMDAHPIHTHLAQFQVLNREAYMGMWPDPMAVPPIPVSTGYIAAYEAAFASGAYEPAFGPPLAYTPSTASGGKYGGNPDITPFLTGGVVPPDPNEAGWKDTVFVPPFMVTRFVVRWGPQHFPVTTPAADIHYAFVPNGPVQSQAWPNGMYDYVWHCHIVDHEDNEMMRPDAVYAPPVVTINSAAADPTTFVLSGGGSYRASGAAPWTATVDYGDGTGVNPLALNTNMTFVFSHTYAQHGSYTITVVVTDRLNTSGTATALVAFTDVPVVNAGPDAAINEGDTFVSSGSFTDPDVDLWTATVDYGDGSGVMALALNADKTFALSHKYTDNGVFTVTVVVMDDEGGSGSDTAIVSVGNAGPVVNAGPDKTIPVGGTFASSGSFTDPGSDAWSATVNYGDGSGTMNLDLTDKTFVLSHVYTTAGSFTVTVTVADDDGGVGSDTAVVTVKAPTQVDADFAPKVFNPNAKGTFKMTVFGSSTFDVRNIDQATVRIGPTPFGNVSTRPTKIQIQDTNADGIADLLAFLDRPDSVSAGQTLVSIWGMTKDGFGFFGTTNIKVLSR
ncbi:multicopper oxidase domain-containing protein [Dehalogenimonas etheniformans]|nr:multicopper oxidase domain-containing protein [Dehalogenimonas etheniformans]